MNMPILKRHDADKKTKKERPRFLLPHQPGTPFETRRRLPVPGVMPVPVPASPSSSSGICDMLEVIPESKLNPARLADGDDLSEEWAKVCEWQRDTIVWMIEEIERLRAKFDDVPLTNREAAMQAQIKDDVSRPRNDVATRVAEGERRGRAEGVRVEPMVG